MYEPFRINYRPPLHSFCPLLFHFPSGRSFARTNFPHFATPQFTPTGFILSLPARAPRRHHRTRTHPSLPFCISSETPLIFSPPNKKRAAFPQPGRRLIFTLHVRERASAFLPGRRRFKHHSAPGQETATLRDRGHTGPQSPADRFGLQPSIGCKACAADPSFRFRRVFSFRR